MRRAHNRISDEVEKRIVTLYQTGRFSYAQVAAQVGVFPLTVNNVMKRNNITGRRNVFFLPCARAFFRTIDSEPKAYLLGFLAADGAIIERQGKPVGFSITLAEADAAHLMRIRELLGSEHKVYCLQTKQGTRQCTLSIRSREMGADLEQHGVCRRKTFTHSWPTTIPDELLHHYVRGYFDGDGSVYSQLPAGYRTRQVRLQMIGTIGFLRSVQEFLLDRAQAGVGTIFDQGVPGMGMIQYGGNPQVARIANCLYQDASIWLPRKHQRLESLLKD